MNISKGESQNAAVQVQTAPKVEINCQKIEENFQNNSVPTGILIQVGDETISASDNTTANTNNSGNTNNSNNVAQTDDFLNCESSV